jgi:hypothetical protein
MMTCVGGWPSGGFFRRLWFMQGSARGERVGFADVWLHYGDVPLDADEGHYLGCQLDEAGVICWNAYGEGGEWLSGVIRVERVPSRLKRAAVRCERDPVEGRWRIWR